MSGLNGCLHIMPCLLQPNPLQLTFHLPLHCYLAYTLPCSFTAQPPVVNVPPAPPSLPGLYSAMYFYSPTPCSQRSTCPFIATWPMLCYVLLQPYPLQLTFHLPLHRYLAYTLPCSFTAQPPAVNVPPVPPSLPGLYSAMLFYSPTPYS
ncbi:hypothetical protein DPMN_036799 [Dreissena polymorpha]|uniref:Uncharacterized protein n=1 Tax=Dreissena polymorpha TaxID=45954 RepID=A0A9D4MC62_DREPO|nr:hypothetical protein DPMN_036799 [Dreissena polymorpha]